MFNGNIIDSIAIRKEQEFAAAHEAVGMARWEYQQIYNLPLCRRAHLSTDLLILGDFIRAKLRDYPKILEKSPQLRWYLS